MLDNNKIWLEIFKLQQIIIIYKQIISITNNIKSLQIARVVLASDVKFFGSGKVPKKSVFATEP